MTTHAQVEGKEGQVPGSSIFQRRLQKSGRASMNIVLPRPWLNCVGLKPQDTMILRWERDGSLHLWPQTKLQASERRCIFDAEKFAFKGRLARAIVAEYIGGIDEIQICATKGIRKELVDDIHQIASKLIGLGIVNETDKGVILKSYVDPTKNDIPQLFVRIYAITSIMLNKLFTAVADGSADLAQEIIQMDDEVDKIYYLMLRQLFTAAKDPAIAQALGVETPFEVIGDRMAAYLIENVGDRCQRSASEILRLLERHLQLDKEFLQALAQWEREVASLYDKSFTAFRSIDWEVANMVIESSDRLQDKLSALTKNLGVAKLGVWTAAMALAGVSANMTSIVEHCRSISQITINRAARLCNGICMPARC